MIINIKKYIEQYKNCIAINFIDSYPSLWLEFLKSHKNLLEQYKKEELFNYNSNIYYEQYRKIEEEFEKIILKNDKISFLCFHAGRYTNEEIEDIRKNGLFTPTIVKLNHKFIKLYNNGYISKQDALKLIKNNFFKMIYLGLIYYILRLVISI